MQIKISLKGTNGDASYNIFDTAFKADTKLLTNSNDGNKPINHSKISKHILKIPYIMLVLRHFVEFTSKE